MFDKKKINFWRLVFIYGGIVIITLFFLWVSPKGQASVMMNSSMGNTMASMHLTNTTIYDLFRGGNLSQQMASMPSQSVNAEPLKNGVGFLGTSIIFLLLPLIIGGTIILGIIWFK